MEETVEKTVEEGKSNTGYRIPKKPVLRNLFEYSKCPLCLSGLDTFQYHLAYPDFWTLVPCSHPAGKDVEERLARCSHWSKTVRKSFQSHALAALDGEKQMNWEDSAHHYRCCLDIIPRIEANERGCRASHLWLQMWAAFALISLYHLKLKDYDKYFDLSISISILLEAHRENSFSYLTRCKRSCKNQFLKVEDVLLNTEAGLQADRNRVAFERGLCNKMATFAVRILRHEHPRKSGKRLWTKDLKSSEVELCGELCAQHGHAGNFGEYFHWKKKLKTLAGKDWWKYTSRFAHCYVYEDIGDEGKFINLLGKPNSNSPRHDLFDRVRCSDPRVEALSDEYQYGKTLWKKGKNMKAAKCMEGIIQRVKEKGSLMDRSTLLFLERCQYLRQEALHTEVFRAEDSRPSWLRLVKRIKLQHMIAVEMKAREDLFVTRWALGQRHSSIGIRMHHSKLAHRYYSTSVSMFDSILQDMHTQYDHLTFQTWLPRDYVHTELYTMIFTKGKDIPGLGSIYSEFADAWLSAMEHSKIVATLGARMVFELRERHDKLDETLVTSSWMGFVIIASKYIQRLICFHQHVQKILHTCCRDKQDERMREFLEYGTSAVPIDSDAPAASPKLVEQNLAKQAFLWGERTLQSSLAYQLPGNRMCAEAQKELHRFHYDDDFAWNVLMRARDVCGAGAVVEYHLITNTDIAAYVVTRNEEVVMRLHDCGSRETCPDPFTNVELLGAITVILKALDSGSSIDMDDVEGEAQAALIYLHKILYAPVADLLQDLAKDEKLVIIAGQGLTKVPFPLLYNPQAKQHLFERHVISLSPSLQVINHLGSSYEALQSYSLVKDHIVGATITDFTLREAKLELQMLLDVFGEENVTRLDKAKVTVNDVLNQVRNPSKEDRCQAFLHFTTHGMVSGRYPNGVLNVARNIALAHSHDRTSRVQHEPAEASACCISDENDEDDASEPSGFKLDVEYDEDDVRPASALSDENREDDIAPVSQVGGVVRTSFGMDEADLAYGVLRSERIVSCGIDLRTFLVVMAACESARGEEYFQGLLNLPRAFMVAGVPSVVGSQYLVADDKSAPHIMSLFYTKLSSGMDVATALCHSMREMHSQGSKWQLNQLGAFVVWGLPTCKIPAHIRKLMLPSGGLQESVTRGYQKSVELVTNFAEKLGFRNEEDQTPFVLIADKEL